MSNKRMRDLGIVWGLILFLFGSNQVFGNAQLEQCQEAHKEALEGCIAVVNALQSREAGASVAAAAGNLTPRLRQAAQSLSEVTREQAIAQAAGARICEEKVRNCLSVCEQGVNEGGNQQDLKALADDCSYGGGAIVGSIFRAINENLQVARQAADVAARAAAGEDESSSEEEGWFSRNWQGLALGAVGGGALGYLASGLFSGDEEEGGDGNNKGKDEDENGESAKNEDGTLNCNSTLNIQEPDCYHTFEANCQYDQSMTGCSKFTNHYCGMTSGSSISSVNAPGFGTTYCQYQVAFRYCKPGGKDDCPSCQELENMKKPECMANPALCAGQNSPEQMEQAKQSCPTDPKFMDPNYSQSGKNVAENNPPPPGSEGHGLNPGSRTPEDELPAPILPGGSLASIDSAQTTASQAAPMNRLSSVQATKEGQNALRDQEIQRQAGIPRSRGDNAAVLNIQNQQDRIRWAAGAQRGIASASGPSDIGPKFGVSLFGQTSRALKKRCEEGLINNCGPRSGLQPVLSVPNTESIGGVQ